MCVYTRRKLILVFESFAHSVSHKLVIRYRVSGCIEEMQYALLVYLKPGVCRKGIIRWYYLPGSGCYAIDRVS